MADLINRGDVWVFDRPGGHGLVMTGEQLSVVIQTNAANHREPYKATIIVPLSIKGFDGGPPHVRLDPSPMNGLKQPAYIKTEQIFTVMKSALRKKVGRLSADDMAKLEDALRATLSIY